MVGISTIECERLQGFPDDWTKYGIFDGEKKEIADTNRYQMLGNSVSVPITEAIGKRLRNDLSSTEPSLHEMYQALQNLKLNSHD